MMNKFLEKNSFDAVVVASGTFPTHSVPVGILNAAKHIICCDAAGEKVLKNTQKTPFAIVGDGDSISSDIFAKYKSIIHLDSDQETNDLTKAVAFCLKQGFSSIAILGATGLREDHTVANISLLAEYHKQMKVEMFSDYGVFTPVSQTTIFNSFPTQQVSIFSLLPTIPITAEGLRYPIQNRCFRSWWEGSMNEALSECFSLLFNDGLLIVFRGYEDMAK